LCKVGPAMRETAAVKRDLRLYATLACVLFCAAGLAALLVLPARWANRGDAPKRFLGLDEPVEKMPPGR
jgi:hypothetical protein